MKSNGNINVVSVPIGDIKPNESNPRTITDKNFKKLVKSLKDFPEMMQLRPLVVDEENVILGGNMRYRAALDAGWKTVPVIVAKGLTDEQKREFVIKDNVSGGEWDWEALANEWEADLLDAWGVEVPKVKESTLEEKEISGKLPTTCTCPSCGYEW